MAILGFVPLACSTNNSIGVSLAPGVYSIQNISSTKMEPKVQSEADINAFICAPGMWSCYSAGATYATGKMTYSDKEAGSTELDRKLVGGNASIVLAPLRKRYSNSEFALIPILRTNAKALGVVSTSAGVLDRYTARTSSQTGIAYLGSVGGGFRFKTPAMIFEAAADWRYQTELLSKTSITSSGFSAQISLLYLLKKEFYLLSPEFNSSR